MSLRLSSVQRGNGTDMRARDEIFIAGNWVKPSDRDVLRVRSPFTEEVVGQVAVASEQDVDRAVRAARDAFPAWSSTSPSERSTALRELLEALRRRADQFIDTIATEMGSPVTFGGVLQVPLPLAVVESFADLLDAGALADEGIGTSLVVKEPIGVVGAIAPWNYPLHGLTNKIAPAIAAGCTIVVKPSELSPLSAYLLFDALAEVGLPDGVVNLVTGYGPDAGEALVGHPEVDMVSFTGSVPVGRRIAELAGAGIKKVALELGGKSANVILDDADITAAVEAGVAKAFQNGGQTCTAWTRMLAPSGRYEEIVEYAGQVAAAYVPGDPHDPATRLGPMVSAAQRSRVLDYVAVGLKEGARLVTGGPEAPTGMSSGHFVAPTVLADVHPDSTVAQNEIFGPVLSIMPYRDEAEAVTIANNSQYGLSGAVWSADRERAIRVARKMLTGRVDINGAAFNPLAPFGGYKNSGIGRELGRYGLEEYLQTKVVQL